VAEFAFAFLDCEFGGLDPELHDITEVAVILTDYRLAELGSAEWRVRARPERITAEAASMSGWSAEAWAEAPPLRQVLTEFSQLLPRGRTVVPAGQNVRMDVQFLERGYRSCEMPYPFDYHVIDLATLFYAWSLVIDGPVPHRAMADARLTLESFRHYVGRLAPRAPSDACPALLPSAI
jgi:oligoribonuclease (3'-5' exoribonuclease)